MNARRRSKKPERKYARSAPPDSVRKGCLRELSKLRLRAESEAPARRLLRLLAAPSIQSSSMPVAEAVMGASVHYGRAELVTLAAVDAAPRFLDRRRVELIDDSLPRAPYHHEALHLDIGAATELVHRVRSSVSEHARAAISTMLAAWRACVLILPASPYDSLPDSLEEVRNSRRLTLAADGMLYREFLAEAAAERGMEVRRYPRNTDPTVLAAEAMGMNVADVSSLVARFGRDAGTPWRKDHKLAAAAALSVLGHRI